MEPMSRKAIAIRRNAVAWQTNFTVTVMLSIPVDVLRMIHEHVNKAGLTKICLVNKVCCSCAQDVLYHNTKLHVYRIDKHLIRSSVCWTLSSSANLPFITKKASDRAARLEYFTVMEVPSVPEADQCGVGYLQWGGISIAAIMHSQSKRNWGRGWKYFGQGGSGFWGKDDENGEWC